MTLCLVYKVLKALHVENAILLNVNLTYAFFIFDLSVTHRHWHEKELDPSTDILSLIYKNKEIKKE